MVLLFIKQEEHPKVRIKQTLLNTITNWVRKKRHSDLSWRMYRKPLGHSGKSNPLWLNSGSEK